jgi:hypothetical protein
MLRLACLAVASALAGCAVVPATAWNYDPAQPQPRPVLAAAEAASLTDRVARLQIERNDIRARIATEPDVWRRLALYRQLHSVGTRLSPLERQLNTYALSR